MALKKGDRVTYTWPNTLIGKPSFTGTGTILRRHRHGVTVRWDHWRPSGRDDYWPDASKLTKIEGRLTPC